MDRNLASILALAGTAAISVTLAAIAPNDAYANGFPDESETTILDPLPAATSEASIAHLKTVYLGCNRLSIKQRLTQGEVMLCSTVHEALKRLAFDGDFEKMLAWSRAESSRLLEEP